MVVWEKQKSCKQVTRNFIVKCKRYYVELAGENEETFFVLYVYPCQQIRKSDLKQISSDSVLIISILNTRRFTSTGKTNAQTGSDSKL